jgi:hypothetical protein
MVPHRRAQSARPLGARHWRVGVGVRGQVIAKILSQMLPRIIPRVPTQRVGHSHNNNQAAGVVPKDPQPIPHTSIHG